MNWTRVKSLWPAWRRRQEQDMREEWESLAAMAGPAELGNAALAMEDARATWSWTWLESCLADVRYSFRSLRANPGFVTVAVLSLALAIGVNSAIFSFADALMLRPLPVPQPSALFDVSMNTPDNVFEGISFPDDRDLRRKSRSFEGFAAYRLRAVAAASDATAPARVRFAAMVSDRFFSVIGVAPAAGRAFLSEEAASPGQPVAILSHDFWMQQYAGSASAIGSSLRINGIVFTIVGIMPEGFTGLDRFTRPSVYLPLGMTQRITGAPADPLEDRDRHDLVVKGRLAPGVSLATARAELAVIANALEREYPKSNHNRRASLQTELARRIQQSPQIFSLIQMLIGLVGLILVIACANVANLLFARATGRKREIAIRLSIGATPRRLLRQWMTESLLIAMMGAALGLAFAYGGIAILQTLSVPSEPPSILPVELDARIVEFGILAALASCFLFGLAPAWQSARTDFMTAMKSGGDGGPGRMFARDTLVAVQVALAMVILAAAAMFYASFRHVLAQPPDFRTDHLISLDTAPAMLHDSPEQAQSFYRQLANRARNVPGVTRVAMTESLPLSPSQTVVSVVPEGYPFPKGKERTTVFGAAVDAGYFQALDVDIVRGRAFTEDDRADSRRVAIVNQQFAEMFWPRQDPLGKTIRLDGPDGKASQVVGVARTGHYLLAYEAPQPFVYLPYAQNPRMQMTLVVQSSGDAASLAPALRALVRSVDPNMPIFNLRTVATLYESRATGTWREFLRMVGTMGCIALALALTGLYGLVAFTVSRRVNEFGIRVAMGARRRDVIWLVERRALALAGTGITIGVALTAAARPLLTAGFPGLSASSPAVYVVVPIALLIVSAVASYPPARRSASQDPLKALRNE